jgi:hypothetical protein
VTLKLSLTFHSALPRITCRFCPPFVREVSYPAFGNAVDESTTHGTRPNSVLVGNGITFW